MPPHGVRDDVFAAKVIGFAGVPPAFSCPSTKWWTRGSNLTVVPGMIVRVRGALIVTAPVAMQTVSATPHVTSVVYTPRTYVVALTVGALTRRTAPSDPRSARATATLLIENREGGVRMRAASPGRGHSPAQCRPVLRFHILLKWRRYPA